MKPILFSRTATDFTTHGLGTLSDVITCSVTEERNGTFELEMKYPMSGIHFNEIELRSIILAKPNDYDDPQPFRVYKISKPMNMIVSIYAQHLRYDLSGIIDSPFTVASVTAALVKLKDNSLTTNPFTFTTDKVTSATMTVEIPSSIGSLLGGNKGSILDCYGGEWSFDKYSCYLHNSRGANRGVKIKYGKNLTSLTQDQNCESVYTGVVGYFYKKDESIVQGNVVNASGTYDFVRILPVDFTSEFEDDVTPTVSDLDTLSANYIRDNDIGVPTVSLKVGFVNISEFDEVHLCDTVTVEFDKLNVSTTAKINKTVYDVVNERLTTIDVGDVKSNIADTIANQTASILKSPTTTDMQAAILSATKLITGNKGGYVVIHDSNGDKSPDEILIMDTSDITTATKVWRWNQGGLGYSNTGYSGDYGTAITMNGEVVADYITAGTLNCENINVENINGESIVNETIGNSKISTGAVRGSSGGGGGYVTSIAGGSVGSGSLDSYNNTGIQDAYYAADVFAGRVTAGSVIATSVRATGSMFYQNRTLSPINIRDYTGTYRWVMGC